MVPVSLFQNNKVGIVFKDWECYRVPFMEIIFLQCDTERLNIFSEAPFKHFLAKDIPKI